MTNFLGNAKCCQQLWKVAWQQFDKNVACHEYEVDGYDNYFKPLGKPIKIWLKSIPRVGHCKKWSFAS